ncbi:MAG: hypothetical protein JZU60_02765 [Ilumatobacteraceae bacterium]|nr:hypothetical protein [Ilumatobacteraceae bacterium]
METTPSLGNTPFAKGNIRRAVLTPSKVMEIRKFYEAGTVTQGQLSRDYGVSVVQIGRIVRGEVWQGLGPVAAGVRELDASAEAMMELQREIDRKGLIAKVVEAKGPTWAESQLTPEAKARLGLFRDLPQVPEVERPSGTTKQRAAPLSPLDGGDGGEDETQGVGVAALGTAKASFVDNVRGLSAHNPREVAQ